MAVKLGDKVTDMLTGFAGQVLQRRESLSAQTQVLVAAEALPGVTLEEPRWVPEPRLRLSKPRSRRNGASVRYSHPGQEKVTAALYAFANRVIIVRPLPGEPITKLADDKTVLCLNGLQDAVEEVLRAVGYSFISERDTASS